MRYAGLCSMLLVIPAACDDAVGSGYPDTTSGSVIASSMAKNTDMPSSEDIVTEPAADTAEAASTDNPEDRAAALGLTKELDYSCDRQGMSAHVVLYGNEEVAAVLIPGKVNVPLYLDCSPTRIGPECSDGQFTAHLNTLDDTAMLYELKDASPLMCEMVQPDLPPDPE